MAGNNYYSNIEPKNIATTAPYKDKGQSYTGNLKSAFSASPIHSGELRAEERQKEFQKLVLDGEVLNGNGFNSFNRDYSANGAPDIPNLKIEDYNLPSPYMPNPTSPGPDTPFDADSKPAFEGKIKDPASVNAQFGSGRNGLYNPAESSKKLSDLGLGSYLPGKSGGN